MAVGGSRRKAALRSLTARLLVLGAKQVGKSASIVRYTTGRYIQDYSDSTNDWLYRHSLGFDSKHNVTTSVELLEQKDIQFCSSSNFFATSTSLQNQLLCAQTSGAQATNQRQTGTLEHNNTNGAQQQRPQASLASRVALDQQIDNEFHEKQQMLNKLHWANAYIVIYAINDVSTFNKAIKYLNLIANNINSPLDNQQPRQTSHNTSGAGSARSSCSSASESSWTSQVKRNSAGSGNGSTSNTGSSSSGFISGFRTGSGSNISLQNSGLGSSSNSSNNNNNNNNNNNSSSISSNNSNAHNHSGSLKSGRHSQPNAIGLSCGALGGSNKIISAHPLNAACPPACLLTSNSSGSISNVKRPILLLANKRDLERSSRQVSTNDGRLLAMRHQTMFAEISIADSGRLIETILANLLEQLDSSALHADLMSPQLQQQQQLTLQQACISQWMPTIELSLSQCNAGLAIPVWANLVRSQPLKIGVPMVAQSSLLTPIKRHEVELRPLIKPVASSQLAKSAEPSKGARKKPMLAQAISALAPAASVESIAALGSQNKPLQAAALQRHLINNRYENLKSSFKRAVGAKLTQADSKETTGRPSSGLIGPGSTESGEGAACAAEHHSVDHGTNSSPLVPEPARKGSSGSSGAPTNPTNWIKNHITSKIGRNTGGENKAVAAAAGSAQTPLNSSSEGKLNSIAGSGGNVGPFKRPLFRYRNRVKTVAFEKLDDAIAATVASGPGAEGSAAPVSRASISVPTTTAVLGEPIETGSSNSLGLNGTRGGVRQEASSSCSSMEEDRGSGSGNGKAGTGPSSSQQSSYDSARYSSNRSSSSLSTTDAYYSSLLVLWNSERRAPSSTGSASVCSSNYSSSASSGQNSGNPTAHLAPNKPSCGGAASARLADVIRPNLRSSMSPGSVSGGSFEADYNSSAEDSELIGDQMKAMPVFESWPISAGASNSPSISMAPDRGNSKLQAPPKGNADETRSELAILTTTNVGSPSKKRYHLVKTVQSTLTNLTRSSNVSAQAAKRSFCNALFKSPLHAGAPSQSTTDASSTGSASSKSMTPKIAPTRATMQTMQPAVVNQLATTEQIPAMRIVGFCK